jgi:phage portal protein BeeE
VPQWKATLSIQEPDGWIPQIQFSGGDLQTLLTQSLWAYVCAKRLADDIASMPGIVQTREPGTDKWVTRPDHQLNDVLRQPYGPPMTGAPKPPWDWGAVLQAASFRLDFGGNAFFHVRSVLRERITALQLIQNAVNAKEDPGGSRVAIAYQPLNMATWIPANEMVNVMLSGGGSYWKGVPTTAAIENAAAIDATAQARLKYDLEHRIAPGAVVKISGYFTMSEEQKRAAEEIVEENFEGAMKAGKSMIVGDNTIVENPPFRQVDDLPAHRKTARDEIIAAHHVAPPVVGVLDKAKYANYQEALRAHWAFGVRPRLARVYNTMNAQGIWPIYGPDVRLWYELAENELGLAVLDARVDTAIKLVNVGHPVGNASERVGLGMARFEGDDQPNRDLTKAGRDDPSTSETSTT